MWRSRSATTLVAVPLCNSNGIALTTLVALGANPSFKLLAEPLYISTFRGWSRSTIYWRSRAARCHFFILVAKPLCKSNGIALTKEGALVANSSRKLLAEPLYNSISRRWSRSTIYWRSRYDLHQTVPRDVICISQWRSRYAEAILAAGYWRSRCAYVAEPFCYYSSGGAVMQIQWYSSDERSCTSRKSIA